ncbi:MAG: alpha/beta hydrolase [Lachnospiraceae bacterium]|nr:alpha/beta hydrolase [Lachnospiraceae bacterium]MBQ4530495.1 alpha/beta hydrolase [Lachnospiraceae bacterium]
MLVYRQFGKRDSGYSLIFLHGSTMKKESMLPIVEWFQEYNCIVPDLSHHGESSGNMPASIEDIARDVEETIANLQRENIVQGKVVLLGYSMGGAITYEVALRNKVKVDGIVFLSSGADLKHHTPLVEQLKNISSKRFSTKNIVDYLFGTLAGEQEQEEISRMFLENSVENQTGYNDLMISNAYDRLEDVKEIQVPTLLVHGCDDKIVLPSAAIDTWKQIADSQLLMVPYGGHALIFENPALVSQRVKGFVERI